MLAAGFLDVDVDTAAILLMLHTTIPKIERVCTVCDNTLHPAYA